MLRKVIATLLTVVVCIPCVIAGELPDAPSQTRKMEDLKRNADILQSSQKKAAVTLNGGKQVKGQITKVTNEGFTLSANGSQQQYSFAEVQTVKKSGMSTAAKVLIGVGVGLGAFIAAGCAVYCGRDD